MFSINPPIPINCTNYICDKRFQLDSIKMLYKEQPYYGLLLISARETTLWLANNQNIKKIKHLELTVTNSHQKGGQSQGRFDRIFQNKRDRNDGYLVEQILETFYDRHANKMKVLGLIIGGNAETRNRVMNDPELDVFREHIIANIPYPDMNALGLYNATQITREKYENKATDEVIKEIENILRLEPDSLDFGKEILEGLRCYKYKKVYYNMDLETMKEQTDSIHHPECEFIKIDSDWLSQYGHYIGLKFTQTF